MYISLARKYRPRTFADVAVQSHVSNTLKGAIARGRVAHGYLLCGPRGVGKTTLARVLAMALNCERRGADGEPCGTCTSCERIWSGAASLDVVEIDAASNRGVDDARELRERAMYAPSSEARYKVYIVDEAHMLTREAWNALLKILEEPPPRVVFVFATTEPQKIAQAAAPVLSRLQRFDFKRIGPADVRARLATVLAAEHVAVEGDALAMLARAADGSMRDALSLTDQALSLGDGALTAARVREALGLVPEDACLEMLDHVAAGDAAAVFPAVARLVDAGVDLQLFLAGLADALRAELALAVGGAAPDLSERAQRALAERAGRFAAGDLLRMLAAVTELEPRFRRSGQQQILLETLLVRFALMDRTVSLEEVLRSIGAGDGGERGGADDGQGDAGTGARRRAPRPAAPGGAPSATRGAGTAPSRRAPTAPPVADAARREAASPDSPAGAAAPAAAVIPVTVEPPPHRPAAPATLEALSTGWADVVAAVRAEGRSFLAVALEHARPAELSERGELTLELDSAGAPYEQPLVEGADDLLAAVASVVGTAGRVRVRVREGAAPDAAVPRRLTEEGIRTERLARLRQRDPALDVAVETLDLELLD